MAEETRGEFFDIIPDELMTSNIIPILDAADLGRLRRVSKSFFKMMDDEGVWMERLTLLVLEHPVLSDLDKGVGESWSQWYARLLSVLADGSAMALKHKAGEYPFLSLYGTIDGATFTPFSSPLRFPVQRGFIAELIHFMNNQSHLED